MGEVWAARHKTLDEEVAIKLVMRNVDHEDGTSAESRFLLEARVAAALSRKTRHIVAVTDHGADGALGYLVMELLAGESLDAAVERAGRLPLAKVVPIIAQIARGLAIAHAEGVVHRDLKASNVFVTVDEDGSVVAKVLDFGIAKLRRGSEQKASHTTQRGFRLGTPAYMSPEQALGKAIDHRADVWALAVIAYYLLTGEFPFDGASGEELFVRLRRVQPIPLRDRLPDAPQIMVDFFARAFARRVEDRFQSGLSLAGAFEQLEPLADRAKRPLPRTPALAIVDVDFEAAGFAEKSSPSSMIAAGVPRKRRLLRPMLAALLLAAVLATTGSLLSVYFEREPSPTVAQPVGPSAADRAAAAANAVPPPDPPSEITAGPAVVTPEDLPALAAAPRASRPAPPSAPVVTMPVAPASQAARHVDKSEVF
jgi:serine/threonine-protein kinase